MGRAIVFLLVIILASCSHTTSENGVISQQKDALQKNPYRILFGYEKIETANTTEGIREVYRLFASNVPPGKGFTLYGGMWGEQVQPLYELSADQDGRLVGEDHNGIPFALADIRFKMGDFRKGEPYEYRLVSKDGMTSVFTLVVPEPAIALSADAKAVVKAVITSMREHVFVCQGEGFKPRELFEVIHHLHDRDVRKRIVADAKGRFQFDLPKSEGNAQLTIERKDEILSLDYGWLYR